MKYQNEWVLTDRDLLLYDLAKRYHDETEAYDRSVCTGLVVHGSIRPMSPTQMGLINRNAKLVFDRVLCEASQKGISREELRDAISKHS